MTPHFYTTTVDILRHGECEGGNIFRGSTDVPLLESGLAAMKNTCRLANNTWNIIISSPLLRCQQFAEWLSDAQKIPMEIDDRLREMSFGDWEGERIDKIREQYPEQVTRWSRNPQACSPPNGETITDLNSRVLNCRQQLQNRFRGKNILVVTHGGVFRVFLSQVLGTPLSEINNIDIPYACLSRYAVYSSKMENTDSGTGTDTHTNTDTHTYTKLLAHNIMYLR